MAKIEIYTTAICPYCHAAKRLLDEKGAEYSEISLTQDPGIRPAMIERAGGSPLCRRSSSTIVTSAAAMTCTVWSKRVSLTR